MIPPNQEEAKRLRAFFDGAGYSFDTLRRGFGLTDRASFRFRKYLLEQESDPSPLDILVQWFECGSDVSRGRAKRIPAPIIDLLESTGLLRAEGDVLRPMAMISPFHDLLIASDPMAKLDGDASDLVVWPNSTTYQLMNAAVPCSGGSVLDLGCGSGVLAVKAAQSSTVTAIDVNPRAAEFTTFNAAFNGVGPIECRIGDCYEPVAGRRFDLILSNPPFFLVPSTGLTYCENPMELDLFARRLMREASAHLTEGGIFQMLCEWVDLAGAPWRERLSEWAHGIGCDVWVLKTYVMNPNDYGKERCEQRPGHPDEANAAFVSWIRYCREKRIEAVHGGVVTLRRRSGTNWIRLEENPTVTLASPVGGFILDGIAAQDTIALPDERLLATRLRLIDGARLRQSLRQDGRKWTQTDLVLSVPGVFKRELEMQPLVAEFAGSFDGTQTLSESINHLSNRVDAGLDTVSKECLAITRKLLERGFLVKAVE